MLNRNRSTGDSGADRGACGPLLQSSVKKVWASAGEPVVSPPVAHRSGGGSTALTPREEEVAVLVSRGLTNREIASELSISERMVTTHVAKILNKLGLSSRSRLSAWVAERGLPLSD